MFDVCRDITIHYTIHTGWRYKASALLLICYKMVIVWISLSKKEKQNLWNLSENTLSSPLCIIFSESASNYLNSSLKPKGEMHSCIYFSFLTLALF